MQEAREIVEALKRGTLLRGRYRIEKVIGEGAMGAVYLARDEHLVGASWAVKVLHEVDLPSESRAEAVALFHREADMCARLRHPGLPEVVDFFSENGKHALVMRRVEGDTLEALLDRKGRPFTEAELLPLLIQLCSCLRHLHEMWPHPIIFRDVKPSNCMVTAGGRLVLIDFGIARYYKPCRKSDTIIIGTPGFCAPEQYGTTQTEPRSDIYALGAMAWHLLSGGDPAAHGFSLPPLRAVAPHASPEMEAVVARCVAFSATDRYPSAAELLEDLLWVRSQSAGRGGSPLPVAAGAVRGRRTSRVRAPANRLLSGGAMLPAPTASVAFSPVRTTSVSARCECIDATFLSDWARRTFRVWWGQGSVHPLRVLSLLFVTMLLAGLAHIGLEVTQSDPPPTPASSQALQRSLSSYGASSTGNVVAKPCRDVSSRARGAHAPERRGCDANGQSRVRLGSARRRVIFTDVRKP